ncbi:MAG TPA: hypothetical protein DCM28_03750 [Phycisphaerales bacterium]|mgnify:CR=1 FL=1|nr:hypothetical protein [Phycisphaerales bacterium]|tara:strand:- start:12883 stop:14148 length:1266 start_codon:yes stop_codon:yes gene_type:complete
MAEDYYKEWLGIDPSTHQPDMPPDHYTLLGLPHFCHHPGAVEISAKQRLEKLDKYAMLPERLKREAATHMMNEVATARVALSDPKHYKRYDELLSKKLGLKVPDKDVPPPSNIMPLLEDEQAYELELDDEGPAAPTGVKPLDASLAAMDGPEIQVEADLNASRTTNTAPIPFTTIIIALSVLFVLILGGVIGVVMFLGSDGDPKPASPFPTAVINPEPGDDAVERNPANKSSKPIAKNPEDMDLGKATIVDDFNRPIIGNNYRVRASAGNGASIVGQKLEMIVGGTDNGESRVEYTPMQSDVAIQQVSFNLDLGPKSTFILLLANDRLRLTLKHTQAGITTEARPGGPPSAQTEYPTIPHSNSGMTVRARRTPYSIFWYVNEILVATSPSMDPSSTATVALRLKGTPGTKATIDNVQVWYP